MTPHSDWTQRRGADGEGVEKGEAAARVEVGGVKGTLADLRTPEPAAVVCRHARVR